MTLEIVELRVKMVPCFGIRDTTQDLWWPWAYDSHSSAKTVMDRVKSSDRNAWVMKHDVMFTNRGVNIL